MSEKENKRPINYLALLQAGVDLWIVKWQISEQMFSRTGVPGVETLE
jgi:hypothetical protein